MENKGLVSKIENIKGPVKGNFNDEDQIVDPSGVPLYFLKESPLKERLVPWNTVFYLTEEGKLVQLPHLNPNKFLFQYGVYE